MGEPDQTFILEKVPTRELERLCLISEDTSNFIKTRDSGTGVFLWILQNF